MNCKGYTKLPNGVYKLFQGWDLSLFLVMYQIYCYNKYCKKQDSFETTFRYLLQELGLSENSRNTIRNSIENLIYTGVLIRENIGAKGKGSIYTINEDRLRELLENEDKRVSQPCYDKDNDATQHHYNEDNDATQHHYNENRGATQHHMIILDKKLDNNITCNNMTEFEDSHYLFEKKVIPKTSQEKILSKYRMYRIDHLTINLEEVEFPSNIDKIKFQSANTSQKTGAILNWIFQGIDEERLYQYLKSLNIKDIDKAWGLVKEEINNNN